MSAFSDSRAFDAKAMTFTLTWEDDDPDDCCDGSPNCRCEPVERTIVVPACYEVCGDCRGTGTHVHPAIDGNGITSSEWAEWDQDDRETYMTGGYDVTCTGCGGVRVVPEVDEAAIHDDALNARYEQYVEWGVAEGEFAAWAEAERDAERRMGA